jgi:hypothetical protein
VTSHRLQDVDVESLVGQLIGNQHDGDITPGSSIPGTPSGPRDNARLSGLGADGLPISGRISRASNGESVSDRPTVGVTTLVGDDFSEA